MAFLRFVVVVLALSAMGCTTPHYRASIDRVHMAVDFDWATVRRDKLAVLPVALDGQQLPSWRLLHAVPDRIRTALEDDQLNGAVGVIQTMQGALPGALESYAKQGSIPSEQLQRLGAESGVRYVLVFRPVSYQERWRERTTTTGLLGPRHTTDYLDVTFDAALTIFDTERPAVVWEGVATASLEAQNQGPIPPSSTFARLLDDVLQTLLDTLPPA